MSASTPRGGPETGQHFQAAERGVRAGVVGIVDHGETGRRAPDLLAHGRRLIGCERVRGLLQGTAQCARDGQRGQRVAHIVVARHGQVHLDAAERRFGREAHRFALADHLHRAVHAAFPEAEPDLAQIRARFAQRGEQGIVPVYKEDGVGAKCVRDVQLFGHDVLAAAKLADVRHADIRHHGVLRAGTAARRAISPKSLMPISTNALSQSHAPAEGGTS